MMESFTCSVADENQRKWLSEYDLIPSDVMRNCCLYGDVLFGSYWSIAVHVVLVALLAVLLRLLLVDKQEEGNVSGDRERRGKSRVQE